MVESIAELQKICHNNARFTDRPWWYRLYRATSIRFTRLILLSGIKINPNHITLLEVIMGISGSLLLLSSNILVLIIGFVFLFAAYLFDCMDGELARYYQEFSSAGSYLDEVGHAIVDPLLFTVLALTLYFQSPSTIVMIMGFLTAFLIRFIKANFQLSSFIFVKEVTSSPETFLHLPETEKTSEKKTKSILDIPILFANSIKHYVITVFIFMLAYTLDYLKGVNAVIPFFDYKLIVLVFYSLFLSAVALAQIIVNLKTIEQEKMSLFHKVQEAIRR
ncbi:MAG: CDP-alcohol phosphatidyltransferase family protein [Nanoarchaeota archaeon]|nr:CDP-alcohol phosphatidyltransferase family protein [Nanoarchaeota archaeon]